MSRILLDEIFQNNKLIISNGGLETSLIYEKKLDLPFFSCIDLFKTEETKQILYDYYLGFVNIAQKHNVPIVINTATWRFNIDWAAHLGYNTSTLAERNKEAVDLVHALKENNQNHNGFFIIVCGELGPRCDGYVVSDKMTVEEATEYHSAQVKTFAESKVDYVSAATMNYVEEAVGVALAAKKISIPVVISFTLNNEGILPSGITLEEAIKTVDDASGKYPHHYTVNCVHPVYFTDLFKKHKDEPWFTRIKGIKPNASSKSHEELDNSDTLDIGDIKELANYCSDIQKSCKNIQLLGGCCGTTIEHIECIYDAVSAE